MLPLWADALILCALPLILGVVLAIYGKDEPDNAIVHAQEDEKPPDRSEGNGDDVLAAA